MKIFAAFIVFLWSCQGDHSILNTDKENNSEDALTLSFDSTPIEIKRKRFFVGGKRVRLAGSHTWNTVQSVGGEQIPIKRLKGNFTRLWVIEPSVINVSSGKYPSRSTGRLRVNPTIYEKIGKKFDLNKVNTAYLDRLEETIKEARDRGMVTAVMLFDGAFNRFFGSDGWNFHPFNPKNNIQNVGPTIVQEIHTTNKEFFKFHKGFVRSVVERLEKYDNVIFEVGNEMDRKSIPFQKEIVSLVKRITSKPVGVSYVTRTDDNWMLSSGADWITPNWRSNLTFSGPTVLDSDHGWALRCDKASLSKAYNDKKDLLLMDGITGTILKNYENMRPCRAFIKNVAN